MRRCNLFVALAATARLFTTAAFGWSAHHRHPLRTTSSVHAAHTSRSTILHRRSRLHSSSLSREQSQEQKEVTQEQHHPHSRVWYSTLETSPNSYVNPSIELAIRPPSEGGTGIVAVDDVPSDTVALCLPLEEVGMIDAASILDSYNSDESSDGDNDAVLTMLKEMWAKELKSTRDQQTSEEGKRLAVLAGVIAHLQLTRYKDVSSWTSDAVKEESHALKESRRLGLFLDAMPLLPQHEKNTVGNNNSQEPQQQQQQQKQQPKHPFPTHFLYWTDNEVQTLLRGTMGQTKAREVRAGIGLVVREFSTSFLAEHGKHCSQTQILNAIFSSFTAVLSRSFGDAAGRDLEGKGRMLVPLVDMLNHDGEDPNVSWKWHVGEGDEDKIDEGRGDIAVTTLRDVKKGEELYKCYGWRPAYDIASSYGFVPALKKERWECAVIPLFPAMLDLAPDSIPTPSQMAKGGTTLDLLLEANYGSLVKAVIAAVDAANEIEARQRVSENCQRDDDDTADGDDGDDDRPKQLDRLEVVSLFRPPPASTVEEFAFPRRQPCVVVGTKIQSPDCDSNNQHHHRQAIQSILPAFRAAASAIRQLRDNHQSGEGSPISASPMAMAAASIDKDTDWDGPALQLILDGMQDRCQTLVEDGEAADLRLSRQNEANAGSEYPDIGKEHRQFRAGVARDVREAELHVLRTLQRTAKEMKG